MVETPFAEQVACTMQGVANSESKKPVDSSHLSISAALRHGVTLGCTWCCYESRADGAGCSRVSPATRVVETSRGPRELCEMHTMRGRWGERTRRVGAVA